MKSLTSLPVFISETDLSPLSQDCDGGSYQTITDFISGLFADGGDGILQFQDGTPTLTSAQWTELDRALATAPNPAPAQLTRPVLGTDNHASRIHPDTGPGDPGAAEPVAARVRGREPGARSGLAARLVNRRRAERRLLTPAARLITIGIRFRQQDPGRAVARRDLLGAGAREKRDAPVDHCRGRGRPARRAEDTGQRVRPKRRSQSAPGVPRMLRPGSGQALAVVLAAARYRPLPALQGPDILAAELVTALVLAVAAARASSGWELAALAWLALIAVPLAFIDIAVQRLPDLLTISASTGTLVLLAAAAGPLTSHG